MLLKIGLLGWEVRVRRSGGRCLRSNYLRRGSERGRGNGWVVDGMMVAVVVEGGL